MIHINLLPPEILEKRKVESRRLYLVAVLLVVLALLGLVWGFLVLQEQIKATDVASAQQEAASAKVQAERYKVFEERTKALQERKAIVQAALTGRIDWSGIMSEVALVIPADLWLDHFTGDQKVGGATAGAPQQQQNAAGSNTGTTPGATLVLQGWSLYNASAGPDNGFKPVAKFLVRLNDMDQLKNVWLASAEVKDKGFRQQTAIPYQVDSEVVVPGSSVPTSSGSVPPPGKQ